MIDKIKQLREQTCASLGDCKKALEDAGGDLEKAADLLKKRGASIADKKACRVAAQGIVESYIHTTKKIGVLIELNCETDFVARNEMFKESAHDIAMHIAAMNPKYLSVEDIPQETIEEEKSIYREQLQGSGKPQDIIEQIISGKIKKHNEEICLLNQVFIKNQDQTIKDLINELIGKLGENIKIGRFVRFEI